MISLACVLGGLGQLKEQKEVLECTLSIVERVHGSDHVQVAEILADLGMLHGEFGDIWKKKRLFGTCIAYPRNRIKPKPCYSSNDKGKTWQCFWHFGGCAKTSGIFGECTWSVG